MNNEANLLNENFIITDRTKDEVFIDIEDKEKTINDIINFFNLKENEKIAYLKNILYLIELYKNEFLELFKEILKKFDCLNFELKNEFINNIQQFLSLIKKYEIQWCLDDEIIIIDIIKYCLFEKHISLKTKMKNYFSKIIQFFDNKNVNEYILPIILELLHDEKPNNILTGVELMFPISNLISKDMLEIFVSTDLLNLSNNEDERIRMESFEALINITNLLSDDFKNNKFNENLIRLINDKNWQVKNTFINNIIKIKEVVSNKFFEDKVSPYFIKYLNINNKWVKENTISKIGELLFYSKENKNKDDLINLYLRIDKLVNKKSIASIINCILPNVIYFEKNLDLLNNRWDDFKKLYINILNFECFEINEVLAKSIHLIAKSLQKDVLVKEFLPIIFKYFLSKKANENIKNKIINNLVYILELIDLEQRDNYADLFMEIQNDTKNWRIRLVISNQMDLLSKLFSNEILKSIINPICLQLCKDQVSKVRLNSCANLFYLFKNQNDENNINILVENIKYFAEYTNFIYRQSFILICNGFINQNWELFIKKFYDSFCNLINDKVVNVRIALGKVLFFNLTNLTEDDDKFQEKKDNLLDLFNKLKDDTSKDVRYFYNKYYKLENDDNIILELNISRTSESKDGSRKEISKIEIKDEINNDKETNNNDKEGENNNDKDIENNNDKEIGNNNDKEAENNNDKEEENSNEITLEI